MTHHLAPAIVVVSVVVLLLSLVAQATHGSTPAQHRAATRPAPTAKDKFDTSSPLSRADAVRQAIGIGVSLVGTTTPVMAATGGDPRDMSREGLRRQGFGFYRSTQFIAALGEEKQTGGSGAGAWGLWRVDPGPLGVLIKDYSKLEANRFKAPAGWTMDPADWWVEEHGLIMPPPEFPLPPGEYIVTGGRQVTTILTVGADGAWSLANQASLFDVTHLPCRSAKYTALSAGASPSSASQKNFPVAPGGFMPHIPDYDMKQYAVLFVLGEKT